MHYNYGHRIQVKLRGVEVLHGMLQPSTVELRPTRDGAATSAPIAIADDIFCRNQRKQGLRSAHSGAATSNAKCCLFCLTYRKHGLRPVSGGAATCTAKRFDRWPGKLQSAYEKSSSGDGEAGGGHPATAKSCNRRLRKLRQPASKKASTGDGERRRRKMGGSARGVLRRAQVAVR